MFNLRLLLLFTSVFYAGMSAATPPPENAQEFHEAPGFTVQVGDDVIPYSVFGIYVMPGERIKLSAHIPGGTAATAPAQAQAQAGQLTQSAPQQWRWQAPRKPGAYRIWVNTPQSGKRILLNVFVMTPFDHQNERLNGYRMGQYQPTPLRGNPVYNRPEGFVEVTESNRNIHVAPHFTLGQFLCKQQDGPPRYLVLRERLLLKLETILAQLNQRGLGLDTLFIMSGYRTPWYNQRIGNRTKYSRHLYGDAADIFPDSDDDGVMDDINGDGVPNRADAELLAEIVARLSKDGDAKSLVGGLGIYGPAPHRGPFVHVDVRGYPARW